MLMCRALNICATHCSMLAALPLWGPLLLAGQGLVAMEGLIFRQWLFGGWFEGQLMCAGQLLSKAHLPRPRQKPQGCGG